MNSNRIIIALIFGMFSGMFLMAQGVYLDPESEREMYKPIITASSTLPPGSSSNYSPDNLMDGTEASWSEGAEGSGVGEYLQVDFRWPDEMKYVMIKNGFGKEKYWKANARIRKMKVSNEEGEFRVIEFEDIPDLQVVGLHTIEINDDGIMEASGGLYGNSFKFEILDVYPGVRWQDACITEMNFNQWYTDWFPMPEEYIYKNLFRDYLDGGALDQSGKLYISSDWDGCVEIEVEEGFYNKEIVSGDGTQGYFAYQVYIDKNAKEFYLLHTRYLRELDYEHIDFNEKVQDDPVWVESFYWDFYKYDIFAAEFKSVKEDVVSLFFSEDPAEKLSNYSGNEISLNMLWLNCNEPGLVKVECPNCEVKELPELIYTWEGNKFTYSPDLP